MSFSSSSDPAGEFFTILWLEDAGEPSDPLNLASLHALAGLHNGFRSSVFHPTTMNSSGNSNLPVYIPTPSHIVKTSSNLIHSLLLQPINSHHFSRYNSPSSNPPPQTQHTTLLAIPPCQPPTLTINQLVDHLLALTTPTSQTKAISRRLNTLSAQYTSTSSFTQSSSSDFYPPVAPATALNSTSLSDPNAGGLLDDGPSSPLLSGGGGGSAPTEDWYDDADDRVIGSGVRSWLKHKKTLVVSKASGGRREGRGSVLGKKSETLAAASFITPVRIISALFF